MLKKFLFLLLTLLLGAFFILSGLSKLYPIEPFELTFVDLGIANWQTAPFIARGLISAELILGTFLLLNIHLRSFTLKWTAIILLVFNFYLLGILIFQGNNGNCGCFGNVLSMTPLQAIIKNLILLLIVWILYKNYEGLNFGTFSKWLTGIVVISSLAMPHVLNYVDFSYSKSYLEDTKLNTQIPLDSLYAHAEFLTNTPDLKEGKHILAFMSLTCPHCRVAAKKMRIMKERNNQIPIYFILNGDKENLPVFFSDTRSQKIPHCMLLGRTFVFLAGTNMPRIFLVNNQKIEFDLNYLDLNQSEIEKWLAQP